MQMTKWTAKMWSWDKENFIGIEIPNLPWSLADALIAKWTREKSMSCFDTEMRETQEGDRVRYTVKPVPEGVRI